MICEDFPSQKFGIGQFVKDFPLENNPLYCTGICMVTPEYF